MPEIHVHTIGPAVTVQDLGRPGWAAKGLSRGGAVDRLAVLEAAALFDARPDSFALLEIMGTGGVFSADCDTRIALTGASMQADIDNTPLAANRTYLLEKGQKLRIGGVRDGVYGYLAFAGGIQSEVVLNSRAAHLVAGVGKTLSENQKLPVGADTDPFASPLRISPVDRFQSGPIRVMPGPQTDYFAQKTRARFAETRFTRSVQGNRQGVRLESDGPGFAIEGKPNIASDLVVPGDIQITGDGVPYALLAESQTTGGYPRIGTIIPADLPRVGQTIPGKVVQFEWLSVEQADASAQSEATIFRSILASRMAVTRDPHDIADLLGYQLISGVSRGDELEEA